MAGDRPDPATRAPLAVTGATGFVGRALLAALGSAGAPVRALCRGEPPAAGANGVTWVRGALDDPGALAHLMQGAGAVVHLAGAVRGADAAAFFTVNATGSAHVAAMAADLGLPLLLVSSLAARAPQLSNYAASKRAAEAAVRQVAGLDWTILRPTAIYGPGDRELAPLLVAMARGVAVRPAAARLRMTLVHVDDVVAAIRAWPDPRARGRVLTLHDGTDAGYSWTDLALACRQVTGRRVWPLPVPLTVLRAVAAVNEAVSRRIGHAPMLTPGKVRELTHVDWQCGIRQARAALDWEPRIPLVDGLARLLGRPSGRQA